MAACTPAPEVTASIDESLSRLLHGIGVRTLLVRGHILEPRHSSSDVHRAH